MIEFFKKNERVILYAGLFIVLLWALSLKTCNDNKDYENQQNKIDSLTLVNQKFDSILNKKNQEVYIQTAIITKNKEDINKLSDSVFDLKKKNAHNIQTIAYLSQYTKTSVKNIKIPYKDTSGFKQFSDSVNKKCSEVIEYYTNNSIKVPTKVEDSTSNFQFKATINKDSFTIDNISFIDSTYIRFVEHKGGLFKRNSLGKVKFWTKRSIEAQIVHTNPYIQVNNMNSVFFVPKVKQRWGERILIAAASAFLTFKIIK